MVNARFGRRAVLSTTATALAAGIAGCGAPAGDGGNDGDGGGDGDDGGDSGDTTTTEETTATTTEDGGDGGVPSAIAEYLNSDPAAGNFDGNIADKTGSEKVSVKVGAQGNGDHLAFSPAALRVSTGTTISWKWTGEGGLHNVVSTDASDFDFKSGDPKESGDPFEQSFDETGVGLYYCDPHRSVGMKGAFEVVE